jgi:hypothetical protein
MSGFTNDIMNADNVNFTGSNPSVGTVTTNGQLMIGSTAAPNIKIGNLTSPGGTVTIGYSSPNITLDVASGGFTWHDVTGATQLVAVQNGYVTDRAGGVTYTLPATANFGDEFIITGKQGLWTLAQNANQQVLLGNSSTTVGIGGSMAATNVGDSITVVCITAGTSTVWRAYMSVGNITIV